MFDYDRSNFIAFLKQFPEQPRACMEFMEGHNLDLDAAHIESVVISGMGGSAIASELVTGYLRDELRCPVWINRDYSLPRFVNQHTLFIAVSYSGNTEETLFNLQEAIKREAIIVGISSGGELERICQEKKCVHIRVPEGLPSRQGVGYLFFTELLLLEKLKLIASKTREIKETRDVLGQLLARFLPETRAVHNIANHIAQSIYHAIPIVYTGVPYLKAVPARWQTQFNENAKAMAFSNFLPEVNHNEILGWEGFPILNRHYRVIILRDMEETPRMQQKIDMIKEILREKRILFGEIFSEGDSRLARMFSLIYIGDWASFYLAMLNEKDPIIGDSVERLKDKLKMSNGTVK